MDEPEQKAPDENLIETVKKLAETYRQLAGISLVEHTSLGASFSIAGLVFLTFGAIIFLFLGLGSAWWIGEAMDNMKAGFFIVGGCFALILIILALTAKKILIPFIRNQIIREIYEQNN